MISYNTKLSNIYHTLKSSDVCLAKKITPETLASFSETLNQIIPTCPEECAITDFVKFLYNRNKSGFYKYMANIDLAHLVLLTYPYPIANSLDIKTIVNIKWSDDRYVVTAAGFQHKVRPRRPDRNIDAKTILSPPKLTTAQLIPRNWSETSVITTEHSPSTPQSLAQFAIRDSWCETEGLENTSLRLEAKEPVQPIL